MAWTNPYYNIYGSGYQQYRPPSTLYSRREGQTGDTRYDDDYYDQNTRAFYGDLTGEGDSSSAAWGEFTKYLTNAMIPYMPASDAQQAYSGLGYNTTAQDEYGRSSGTNANDATATWSQIGPGSWGGRTQDTWFDSADRWNAIASGLNEAMQYLWGQNPAGTAPQTEGDNQQQDADAYNANMRWLQNLVALGQQTGLRDGRKRRTRYEEYDRDNRYKALMSQGNVNSNVKQLGKQLWDFQRRSTPLAQQSYQMSERYNANPGQGAFYSYSNAGFR